MFGAVGLLVCCFFTALVAVVDATGAYWLYDLLDSPRSVFWPPSIIFLALDGEPNWSSIFWEFIAIATAANVALYFLIGVVAAPLFVKRVAPT